MKKRIVIVLALLLVMGGLSSATGAPVSNGSHLHYGLGLGIGIYTLTSDMVDINQELNEGDGPGVYTACFANVFVDYYIADWFFFDLFIEGGFAAADETREDGEKFPGTSRLTAGFLPGIASLGNRSSGSFTINAGVTYNKVSFDEYTANGWGFRVKAGLLAIDRYGGVRLFMMHNLIFAKDNGIDLGEFGIYVGMDIIGAF